MKAINGEKASYNTCVFKDKRERTYHLLLEEALTQYGGERREGLAGSRKRQDTDTRKDVFVKVGQSVKLENTLNGELGVLTPNTPSFTRQVVIALCGCSCCRVVVINLKIFGFFHS